MDESIFNRVRDIIVEQLNVNPEHVTATATLENDLGADSLDHVEIIMAIESEFSISFSDDDAEGITTVGQAVEKIEELGGK